MTQEQIEAKIQELELTISIQTEALGLLGKTVEGLQESLNLLVTKLTEAMQKVGR